MELPMDWAEPRVFPQAAANTSACKSLFKSFHVVWISAEMIREESFMQTKTGLFFAPRSQPQTRQRSISCHASSFTLPAILRQVGISFDLTFSKVHALGFHPEAALP
jgi:hypothetical protein